MKLSKQEQSFVRAHKKDGLLPIIVYAIGLAWIVALLLLTSGEPRAKTSISILENRCILSPCPEILNPKHQTK